MEEILLHICCGICASSAIDRLREDGFKPTGFFYNPNIQPKKEYLRRLEVAKRIADILKFELIAAAYDKERWFLRIRGFEGEIEGGRRCSACFRLRLEETEKKANTSSISKFSTTLTVSPHKNTKMINQIGKSISQSRFLGYDFKKQEGFRLAIEFAKRYNLYRQDYCGCIYSKKAKQII